MTDKNDGENEDKKVICDEEREQMLNKENVIREEVKDIKDQIDEIDKIDKIDKERELEKEKEAEGGEKEEGVVKTGEVEKRKKQIEESQKESRLSGIRVPIGGIKIPGFLRSRSKDKNKDVEGAPEEGVDLLETGAEKGEKTDKPEKVDGGLRATLARRLDTLAARNPFVKKDSQDTAEDSATEQPRPRLLDRIKLPSVNVFPKRFGRGNKEQKDEAELASAETLDEGKPGSPDDGMESVKLDGDGDGEKDPEKAGLAGETPKRPLHLQWWDRIQKLSRHEKAIAALILLLLTLLIIIFLATSSGPAPTSPPVVNGKVVTTTQCGPVEGTQDGEAFAFLGIPYAAPPVGRRRWKPAQPLNNLNLCWNDTLYRAANASSTRQCWREVVDSIDGFEDCLVLDIWTPEVRYINPVPVVVLIETASLLGGPPGMLTPTSKIVHDREVVFVKPNFRLSVLGFLAATPLSQAERPPSSGNYGLTDIIVALQWVRTNIAHFGGDPSQVTLLGHRAGGTLVTALASSPAAKGLFHRAWASSGSAIFPGAPLNTAEQNNQAYVDALCQGVAPVNQLECLQGLGAESLVDALEDNSWKSPQIQDLPEPGEDAQHEWLVLDGRILQTHVWEQLAERHADLVVGTTAHSEASATLRQKIVENDESVKAIVERVRNSAVGHKGLSDEALTRYNTTWEGYVSMVTDIRTLCPLLTMSRSQPNITFYVATQPRNRTDLGYLADVSLDVSAILGLYTPDAAPQHAFVTAMQDLFYGFVMEGRLPPLPRPAPTQSVLSVAQTAEWRSDYPNCGFWVTKELVPNYARMD